MALIVQGKTTCPICKKVIEQDDNTVAFSGFIANDADPLSEFNDSAFHADCFASHPLAERCQEVYQRTRSQLGPGERTCASCGKPIDDPDDYFTLGCLTSDEANAAFQFNCVQLHHSCVSSWALLGDAIAVLRENLKSGALQGNAIDRLLAEMEKEAS